METLLANTHIAVMLIALCGVLVIIGGARLIFGIVQFQRRFGGVR